MQDKKIEMKVLKMFSEGKTEWTLRFDQEEYNCAVRYLSNPKFNLTVIPK